MPADGEVTQSGVSRENMKSGILNMLRSYSKSGFTVKQIVEFLYGREAASPETSDLVANVNRVLDDLLQENAVLKKSISTKSGMKYYFKIA